MRWHIAFELSIWLSVDRLKIMLEHRSHFTNAPAQRLPRVNVPLNARIAAIKEILDKRIDFFPTVKATSPSLELRP